MDKCEISDLFILLDLDIGGQKNLPTNYQFNFINVFIYLFLAALGLCCCMQAFSSCSEQGLLFFAVPRLLTAVASLVAEHGL